MKWALVLIAVLSDGSYEEHTIREDYESLEACALVLNATQHVDLMVCRPVTWRYASATRISS